MEMSAIATSGRATGPPRRMMNRRRFMWPSERERCSCTRATVAKCAWVVVKWITLRCRTILGRLGGPPCRRWVKSCPIALAGQPACRPDLIHRPNPVELAQLKAPALRRAYIFVGEHADE